jgi:NAD(P)-dependent dehydrogenase (short-subunit alcohol dehydrogenase family)
MTSPARTNVITGTASSIGLATRKLIEAQGHRLIGVDIRGMDVIADLSTSFGRQTMIDEVPESVLQCGGCGAWSGTSSCQVVVDLGEVVPRTLRELSEGLPSG